MFEHTLSLSVSVCYSLEATAGIFILRGGPTISVSEREQRQQRQRQRQRQRKERYEKQKQKQKFAAASDGFVVVFLQKFCGDFW